MLVLCLLRQQAPLFCSIQFGIVIHNDQCCVFRHGLHEEIFFAVEPSSRVLEALELGYGAKWRVCQLLMQFHITFRLLRLCAAAESLLCNGGRVTVSLLCLF